MSKRLALNIALPRAFRTLRLGDVVYELIPGTASTADKRCFKRKEKRRCGVGVGYYFRVSRLRSMVLVGNLGVNIYPAFFN